MTSVSHCPSFDHSFNRLLLEVERNWLADPPVKIKYVTTAKPNISNSNQTREIASTAIFLTALSIVAYVTRAFESERAG